MTEESAIQTALLKKERWGHDYLVTYRSGANDYGIEGFIVIAKSQKRLYASDETLVFDTEHDTAQLLDNPQEV